MKAIAARLSALSAENAALLGQLAEVKKRVALGEKFAARIISEHNATAEHDSYGRNTVCGCEVCDLADVVSGLVKPNSTAPRKGSDLRAKVLAFIEAIEERERRIEAPKTGMQVGDFGEFLGVEQLPSVRRELRWWARELRAALGPPNPPTSSESSKPSVGEIEMQGAGLKSGDADRYLEGLFSKESKPLRSVDPSEDRGHFRCLGCGEVNYRPNDGHWRSTLTRTPQHDRIWEHCCPTRSAQGGWDPAERIWLAPPGGFAPHQVREANQGAKSPLPPPTLTTQPGPQVDGWSEEKEKEKK